MRRLHKRSGLTLIELVIAGAILAVMTVALTMSLERQSRSMQGRTAASSVELNAEILLDRMVSRLKFARWADTRTQLAGSIDNGQGAFDVEEIAGFPPSGNLILESGIDSPEVVTYAQLDPGNLSFVGVQRGTQCTSSSTWPDGTAVHWEGLALYTTDQVAPDPDDMDGISMEMGREVFYLGGGTGLVFQAPIRDAAGTILYEADGDLAYGAAVNGVDENEGYYALVFEQTGAIVEEALAMDLNFDGDEEDLFDLGHIRLLTWRADDPDSVETAVFSQNSIVQEACNYGSDLDGDGFDDPMFLLDPNTGRLRVRIFSFSGWAGTSGFHRDELTVFLVNSISG